MDPTLPDPPPTSFPDVRTILKGWSAKTHWAGSPEGEFAIDWYAAPLGTEFGWLTGGHTRGVAMAGPLFVPMGGHDCVSVNESVAVREYKALNDPNGLIIKMCQFGEEDWRPLPKNHIFLPEGYALYTLILDADDGQTMFAFTHVLREARLDVDVLPNEPFVRLGDSALEPFTQRGQNPAHIHFAIMIDRNQFGRWQGGQGNVKPWNWLQANGFQIRQESSVPSPQMYLQGYVNNRPY